MRDLVEFVNGGSAPSALNSHTRNHYLTLLWVNYVVVYKRNVHKQTCDVIIGINHGFEGWLSPNPSGFRIRKWTDTDRQEVKMGKDY